MWLKRNFGNILFSLVTGVGSGLMVLGAFLVIAVIAILITGEASITDVGIIVVFVLLASVTTVVSLLTFCTTRLTVGYDEENNE